VATQIAELQGQATFEQHQRNAEGHHRKQYVAKHVVRAEQPGHRANDNSNQQQCEYGWHPHAPGQPLCEHTEHDDRGDNVEQAFVHPVP
jgi:hypothetical protein